eukprot:scaffold4647_cov393-Prasinococcus_capsulatus_cf.AAC.15
MPEQPLRAVGRRGAQAVTGTPHEGACSSSHARALASPRRALRVGSHAARTPPAVAVGSTTGIRTQVRVCG